ncbi:hypothetical protein EZI54_23095 [Marinobacter halodurans]|uniref:SRPBCC domain-containing protein n=1 Tax=Marinobacter halodurans TaxID=2528979 RepID=A0ABY1ZHD2_9GAMM|nr:DUF6228 family protein [Marinobacter halodurans]TBW46842.1 hypothetical protein EZI54_23095 [Marinobacter halodurans]
MKITGDNEIFAEFHSPEVNDDGWLEYYSLTLSGPQMRATVRVSNPPYGESPVDFFESIAASWQGWNGAKEWASLEGEYQMSAKTDSTGHITLSIRMWSGNWEPYWSSEVAVVIEAGQLENLARKIRGFIYPTANK